MLTLMHAISMVPAVAASCLISAIWQGAILAACVTMCLYLLPEMTAAVRSMIWTALFVLVIALHLPTAATKDSMIPATSHGSALHLDFRWSLAIVSFWILLSLVRGLQLGIGLIRLRRIAKNAVPFEAGSSMKTPMISAPRPTQLCSSSDVDVPCVIGFASPRILIPSALLEKLSPSQAEHIVLHEMEHLRRRDDWINLLQKISLVLFPLNPVLQWIDHRLCIERELACDEGVLRFTQAPKAYATCLSNLAEHSLRQGGAPLALRAWERRSELLSRIHRILRQPTVLMARGPARIVTSLLLMGTLGVAVGLSRCPQLVSFANSGVPISSAATQSAGSVPAYREAVFHPGSVHSQFIKAVLPENKPMQPASIRQPQRHATGKRRIHHHAVASTLLLLTDWNGDAMSQHIEFAVGEKFRPSAHPATRSLDGWLVFQL
jgi:beta-lactamase regulating signal transducer with metallopeptidase domain